MLRSHPTLFKKFRQRLEKKQNEELMHKHAYKGIMLLQLSGLAFDLPNYLAGYTRLNFLKFIITVFLTNLIVSSAYIFIFRFIFHA